MLAEMLKKRTTREHFSLIDNLFNKSSLTVADKKTAK